MAPIYTIGHGSWQTWGKTPERFDQIVRSLGPEPRLVDVRSRPGSRHLPWCGSGSLRKRWGEHYLPRGEDLGGEAWCTGGFRAGLQALCELADLAAGGKTLCLMCSETDPARCHRHWLCAVYLETLDGVSVTHVTRGPDGAPRLLGAWALHQSLIDGTEPRTHALDD